MVLQIQTIAKVKVKTSFLNKYSQYSINTTSCLLLYIIGKKKSRKIDKSRKSRKASTDEEKSDKGGSSSDSEEERKHVEKNKKIRDSNRGGKIQIYDFNERNCKVYYVTIFFRFIR